MNILQSNIRVWLCSVLLISIVTNVEGQERLISLVTVNSLPSGATVFLEEKISLKEETSQSKTKKVGKTPLQLSLPRNKNYIVWIEMDLEDYRVATQGIEIIQKRLDIFERNQKYGLAVSFDSFFDVYTSTHQRIETPPPFQRLVAVRIPHELQTDAARKRICGVFIPSSLNADALLPLVPKREVYSYSKEGYWRVMKRRQVPEQLIASSYQLILRAGVALVIFPIEKIEGESPQEMVIHVTLPDPEDREGLSVWSYYVRRKLPTLR